jgi:hypothetical protein
MATSPLTLQLQQSFSFSHSLKSTLLSNYDYESFPSTTTNNFNSRKLTAIQCSSHNSPVETTTKNSVRRFSKKTTSPYSSSHTDKRVSLESKSVNSTSYGAIEKKKQNENETKNAAVEKKNNNNNNNNKKKNRHIMKVWITSRLFYLLAGLGFSSSSCPFCSLLKSRSARTSKERSQSSTVTNLC